MTGRYRRVAALICFVCCVLCSTLSVTAAVADQEKRHVIKVGYIDYDGFITEEKDGTYTGYGVEPDTPTTASMRLSGTTSAFPKELK